NCFFMRSKLRLLYIFSALSIILSSYTNTSRTITKSRYGADTSYPSFIKAVDHKGKTINSSNELIRFSTGMENEMYRADTISRHCYLYLGTEVKALLGDSIRRFPLNISIVIDRSGSMKGEKMDRVIEAANNIIDKLSPSDIVSIIAYGDDVDVVQPAVAVIKKEQIKEKIGQIRAHGGTNLWGGCETGYYQVIEHAKPGFINHVFLLSDGLANVGMTSSKGIKMNVQRFKDDENITLSSFGVGLDFNEVLLSEMAETGSGNYYFIEAPEMIKDMLETELNSLLHIAAREVIMTLQIPMGVKPQTMNSFAYSVDGQTITIKLKNLNPGEKRDLLLDLKIADSVKSLLPFKTVLTCIDARTGQKMQLENANILTPASNNQYVRNFNREVIGKVLLNAAGENMEAVMEEVDKYNYAGAGKILEQNHWLLDKHRNYINEFQPLQQLDWVSNQYTQYLQGMKSMTRDSVRLIQKTNRATLYHIRNGN
ncbi:MAG TPA: VWA domain-containing protein, partial [Flavisolibacter sp.]|nr:VWA domain-containing protein [Flavisolibacter sp.]